MLVRRAAVYRTSITAFPLAARGEGQEEGYTTPTG
jgi:hypothetical protein